MRCGVLNYIDSHQVTILPLVLRDSAIETEGDDEHHDEHAINLVESFRRHRKCNNLQVDRRDRGDHSWLSQHSEDEPLSSRSNSSTTGLDKFSCNISVQWFYI